MKFFSFFLFLWFLQSCSINQQDSDYQLAAQYNMRLGLAYLGQGNMHLAKSKLLRALQQSPSDANVNSALAYFYAKTNDVRLADKYYINALKLSANSGEHLHNYANFLCKIREFQKADRYFILAINDVNYVDTAGAFASAGLCSFASGDKVKAENYFKQAINRDPKLKKSIQLSMRKLR